MRGPETFLIYRQNELDSDKAQYVQHRVQFPQLIIVSLARRQCVGPGPGALDGLLSK